MTLREASKMAFSTVAAMPSHEEIRTGSLQRIADAAEIMAQENSKLIRERKRAMDECDRLRAQLRKTDYRLRNARGQITKLKRRQEMDANLSGLSIADLEKLSGK